MKRAKEKRYMRTFKDEACWACGSREGVVGAHLNLGRGGTGYRAEGCIAALCTACHDVADGRVSATHWPLAERQKVWLRVAQKLMLDRYEAF